MVPTSTVTLDSGAALQELSTRAMLTLESRRKQMRITSGTAETESGSEEDSEIRNLVLLLAAKWTLCCSSAELVSAGWLKWPDTNLLIREDFPTPGSPTTLTRHTHCGVSSIIMQHWHWHSPSVKCLPEIQHF